ncbi:hypothetical protein ACWIWK_01010 [Helicobacter sp. 23-1048]
MFDKILRLLAFVPIFALVGCHSGNQSAIDSAYFGSGNYDFAREGFCGIYHAHWDWPSDDEDDEFVSKINDEKKRCFANLSNSCDSGNMRDCAALGYLLHGEHDDKYKKPLKKACDGKYGGACYNLASSSDDLEIKNKLYKQGCEYGDFMSCHRLWWRDESDKSTSDWAKARAKKLSAEACERMQKIIATEPEYDIYIDGVGNLKDFKENKKIGQLDDIYIQGIGLESEFNKMQNWLCNKAELMQRLED